MVDKVIIGNLELTPQNGYFISKINNVGFATKYPSSTVLYKHGAVIGDVYLHNRLLSIELMVKGSDYEDLYSKKYNLIKEFGVAGSSDKITIKFYLSNNDVVETVGVPKEFDESFTTRAVDAQFLRFSLETESAFFKSSQIYQVNIPITKGGGASVPMEIPLNMTQGSTGYKYVSVGGNAVCFPQIYFYGKLTNPVLTNRTTGQTLSLSLTINNGEWVEIDTENRIVIDHLGVNKRDKMSGDFIFLVVGSNEFSLQSDIGSEDGYVSLIFRNFYKAL